MLGDNGGDGPAEDRQVEGFYGTEGGGCGDGDLEAVRTAELTAVSQVLGLRSIQLLAYPDGRLPDIDLDQLASRVTATARDIP